MESQIQILKNLIKEGNSFTFANFSHQNDTNFGGEDTAEWLAWKTRVLNLVRRYMADESPACHLAKEAMKVRTDGNYVDKFDRARTCLLKALEIALNALQQDDFGELRKSTSEAASPKLSNKVFVVHGHDQGLKTDIERFLHEIGLEPVVLHRQPDQGQTIIEKFEKHSDVGYTFILLTPDEVAYTVDQEATPDAKRSKEKRARPNVIFEFGYFVGKLGRNRVCCLHKGDVILPSDLNGIVYKPIDSSIDSQAFQIIRELKAAGYTIKM